MRRSGIILLFFWLSLPMIFETTWHSAKILIYALGRLLAILANRLIIVFVAWWEIDGDKVTFDGPWLIKTPWLGSEVSAALIFKLFNQVVHIFILVFGDRLISYFARFPLFRLLTRFQVCNGVRWCRSDFNLWLIENLEAWTDHRIDWFWSCGLNRRNWR